MRNDHLVILALVSPGHMIRRWRDRTGNDPILLLVSQRGLQIEAFDWADFEDRTVRKYRSR